MEFTFNLSLHVEFSILFAQQVEFTLNLFTKYLGVFGFLHSICIYIQFAHQVEHLICTASNDLNQTACFGGE